MSYRRRIPDWFREDETVLTINDETEEIKIKSYYDILRQYVKQPLQLWAKYKKEQETLTTVNIEQNLTTSFDITNCYSIMPYIEIQDYSCCTPPNAVTGPITFDDGKYSTEDNKYTINLDIPSGGKLQIYPNGDIKLNGEGIKNVIGVQQPEDDKTIPFGKVTGYRKIKQNFTPSEYTESIEIKIKNLIGAPDDNIIIQLWTLNNNELDNIILEKEITNESLLAHRENILITLDINQALDQEEHALVIKREFEHDDRNYFSINTGESNALGELSVWDGSSWNATPNNIFLIERIPFITGNYPTIDPTSGSITIGYNECAPIADNCEFDEEGVGVDIKYEFNKISLDKIYTRAMAYVAYPLKNLKCYIGETLLQEVKWIKEKKQYCYLLEISAEDIPPELISEMPFEFWAQVEWHYFDRNIKHGFPQNADHEDPIFWPNELLDRVAKDKGLFRRTYKSDIPYYEYDRTYPLGYPYDIEQDYCLEKRLLNEYVTHQDKQNEAFLYDIDNTTQIIKLKSKSPYSYPIEIIGVEEEDEIKINIKWENELREEFSESFLFINSKQLTWDINENSEILEAELIYDSTDITLYEPQFINPEGIYKRYGLIKSEIYGYLGRIPHIQDMVDYCSIWDKTCWGYDVWGGDIWSPSVFRVDIPYPLPSNFNELNSNEISNIIDRCKAVGTESLSAYSYELFKKINLNPKEDNNYFSPPEGIYEQSFNIDLESKFGDKETVTEEIKIISEWIEREISSSKQKQISLDFNVMGATIYSHFSEEILEDYSENCQINTVATAIGSVGYEKININDTVATTGIGAKSRYENINPSGWLAWHNASKVGNNQAGVAYTDVSRGTVNSDVSGNVWHGLPYTDGLVVSNFNIKDIPDESAVTGIKINFSCNVGSPNTNCYAQIRTPKGNATKIIEITQNSWSEHSMGKDQDTWTIRNLTGEDIKEMEIMFWFGEMPAGAKIELDWCTATIYTKHLSGRFITPSIFPITPPTGTTGTWGKLTDELIEDLAPGNEIYYDILTENYSFGVQENNDSHSFGLKSSQKIMQLFKPTTSQISGFGIFPDGVNGLPTDRIQASVYTLDSNLKPVALLQQSSVSVNKWLDKTGSELIFPFDLTNLSTTILYGIIIERIGALSDTNYYSIKTANNNLYNNGRLRFITSKNTWSDHNNGQTDLHFKAYTPVILLANQKSPINLREIPYTQIKIRGKLFTNTVLKTPKVSKIKIDREVRNND